MDAYPKAAMERAMRVQDVEVADAEEDRFGPFYLARIPHQGGALLDSEIACVDASGRPPFDDLPFRRREPRLFAFDLLI